MDDAEEQCRHDDGKPRTAPTFPECCQDGTPEDKLFGERCQQAYRNETPRIFHDTFEQLRRRFGVEQTVEQVLQMQRGDDCRSHRQYRKHDDGHCRFSGHLDFDGTKTRMKKDDSQDQSVYNRHQDDESRRTLPVYTRKFVHAR